MTTPNDKRPPIAPRKETTMTTTIERLRALLLDDGWDVETRAEALLALAEIEAAWTMPIEDVEREAQKARKRYEDRGVGAGSTDEAQRACWVEAVRPLVEEVARLRRRLAALDNPVRQALDADDRATATRWAEWRVGRACSVHGVSPWDVMGTADREVEIAAMLPLVHEMRAAVAAAAEAREGAAWGVLREIAAVVLPNDPSPSVMAIVDAAKARPALTWQQATDIALALAPEGDVAEQARTVMRIAGARHATKAVYDRDELRPESAEDAPDGGDPRPQPDERLCVAAAADLVQEMIDRLTRDAERFAAEERSHVSDARIRIDALKMHSKALTRLLTMARDLAAEGRHEDAVKAMRADALAEGNDR